MADRNAWVALIRSFEGTPYHHQGRLPGVGMDCPAPIICAAWAFGIKPRAFDVTGYSPIPDGTLEQICEEHMRPVLFQDALPGDVILGRFGTGHAQHMGVLVDNTPSRRYWIHAEGFRHKRVMLSRLVFGSEPQSMRLVGAFRVPGVA